MQSEIGILEEEALRVGEAAPGILEENLCKLVHEGEFKLAHIHFDLVDVTMSDNPHRSFSPQGPLFQANALTITSRALMERWLRFPGSPSGQLYGIKVEILEHG